MPILAGENSSEATLKFSSRNKKEDKSKKPRSKENIALPSEEETATRDRGEATATTDMYRQLYLRYFFPCLCFQFNSILFDTEGQNTAITMPTQKLRENTANTQWIHNESDQKR